MEIFDIGGNKLFPTSELDGLQELRTDRLLVWHDEFNGVEIDPNKWEHGIGERANRPYWMHLDVRKNVSINGGLLDYYALRDNPKEGFAFSVPYLTTNKKFEFRYGLIEARIKFSSEPVFHSTLWTLGANSQYKYSPDGMEQSVGMNFPSCGEIDMAECDNGVVVCTKHYSNAIDGTTVVSSPGIRLTTDAANWHIYGLEWTDTEIRSYVDRVLIGTWSISSATLANGYNPFKLPHYLILNSIPTIKNTPVWDEMHTLVDWVRVYAPEGVTEIIEETAISLDYQSLTLGVGDVAFLTPSLTPANTSDMTIQWISMNEDICTCYAGKVKGVAAGTTFVKAISKNGYYALCKVQVNP